jgi:hypothetical protein
VVDGLAGHLLIKRSFSIRQISLSAAAIPADHFYAALFKRHDPDVGYGVWHHGFMPQQKTGDAPFPTALFVVMQFF